MGKMDKLLGFMKVGQNEDDYYDDYEEDGYSEDVDNVQVEQEEPQKTSFFEKKASAPQPVARKKTAMNDSSVCIFKPVSIDEAREIAETLINNNTVLLNFEGVDLAVSQRILDTITGVCIAIRGNLQKISNFIFIATPASVDVSGDLQDNLAGVFESL